MYVSGYVQLGLRVLRVRSGSNSISENSGQAQDWAVSMADDLALGVLERVQPNPDLKTDP